MPREATISYEQVAVIAQAIKADGGKPSPRLIRERHGSGSLGTIHKLFQQWVSKESNQIETTIALPPGLQRVILEFVHQELASSRAELEIKLADAVQAGNDLAIENERQVNQMEDLESTLTQVQDERASYAGRVAQLEMDLAAARSESARERQAAEVARTELAKVLLRLEAMPGLEAENQRLRSALDDERHARTDAERSAAAAEAKAAGLSDRLADTQSQLQEQKQVFTKLELEKKQLDASLAVSLKEVRTADVQIGKLEGTVATLERQLAEQLAAEPSTGAKPAAKGGMSKK